MKKLLVLFLFSISALAQNTTVSGIIVDTDGTVWANGSWQAQLINPSGGVPLYCNGGGAVVTQYSGVLNSSGAFSQVMADNTQVCPAGTLWQFTFASHTSAQASQISALVISGATFDISSYATLNITAPRIKIGNLAGIYAYIDAEIVNQTPGNTYWNVSSLATRQWTGFVWQNLVSSSWNGGTVFNPISVNSASSPGYNCTGTSSPCFQGSLSGNVNNICYANNYSSLSVAISSCPSGYTLIIPNGTYTLPAITISNPITIVGSGQQGSIIQITGSPNIAITIAASNVWFDNLDISGDTAQLFNIVGQHKFHLTRSKVHNTATLLYTGSSNCSAVAYMQGGSDHWFEQDEFTLNGINPVTGFSYDLCSNFDINSTNYFTSNIHVIDSWFHGSLTSFPVALLNADTPDIRGNNIDQGNNWDGTNQAYGINLYNSNEGNCNSIVRISGTVTCNFTSSPPAMQFPVGAPILVHLGGPGTGGTDFNGPFVVSASTSNSVSWLQTGVSDDTGGAIIPVVNFGFKNGRVNSNFVTNTAGNGIYLQSRVGDVVSANVVTNSALQMPDTSLCQGGISMAGYDLNVSDNIILNSTKSGICTDASHSLTSGNKINGAKHYGIFARGALYSNFTGDNIANSTPAGIGGDVSGSYDGKYLTFSNEQIHAAAGGAGYAFAGADDHVKITGGFAKAASSGSLSYGIIFTNAAATLNSIENVLVDCIADQSTATPPTATFLDGISYAGTASSFKNNTVNGCKSSLNAFGIFEAATGTDNTYYSNSVTNSYNGFESIGVSPHVSFNNLWNNIAPIACGPATTPDCTQNILTETGTLAINNAQISSLYPFTSTEVPPITYSANFSASSVSANQVFGGLYVTRANTTYTQFYLTTTSYAGCSVAPTIEVADCGAAASNCSTSTPLTSAINVPLSAGGINGITVSFTPVATHFITFLFASAGSGCTGLNLTSAITP